MSDNKYDSARLTFDSKKKYSSVKKPQGTVDLDADWNEQADIDRYYERASLTDIIGHSGTPIDNVTGYSDGFRIIPLPPKDYQIKAGHYYVEGILCENEADVKASEQQDLPNVGGISQALPGTYGTFIVYLDVWEKLLTGLDDPSIRDAALGGLETAVREKIVWQVKAFQVTDQEAKGLNCLSDVSSWKDKVTPSTGMIRARARPTEPSLEPCILPPRAGFIGLKNQLYRVEISDPGEIGPSSSQVPTYKWSRENGSIVSKVLAIDEANNTLGVDSTGRDNTLGFNIQDWAEVSDDRHDLWGIPGTLVRITDVDVDLNTLTFDPNSATGDQVTNTNYPQGFKPKVRRWDGSTGLNIANIPTTNFGYIELEDGVEFKFEEGTYRAGDYWLIRASPATTDIEWAGITYHMRWGELTGSDVGLLKDFLLNGFGAGWVQPLTLSVDTANPNNIIATDGTHSLFLRLNNDNTSVVLSIDNKVMYAFPVSQENGNLILTGSIPEPLPPTGIKHHYAKLAIISYDSTNGIQLIEDCRNLFGNTKAQAANTGIIKLVTAQSGVYAGPKYGPFLHYLADQKTPPAILLGYAGWSESPTHIPPGLDTNVQTTEDWSLYQFGQGRPSFKPTEIDLKSFYIMTQGAVGGVAQYHYIRWWAIPAHRMQDQTNQLIPTINATLKVGPLAKEVVVMGSNFPVPGSKVQLTHNSTILNSGPITVDGIGDFAYSFPLPNDWSSGHSYEIVATDDDQNHASSQLTIDTHSG